MSAKRNDTADDGLKPGTVAMLPVKGVLTPVRVVGAEGRKYRTADPEGVERIVAPARFLWVSAGRVSDGGELARYWDRVQARAEACDLAMAWELLAEAHMLEPTGVGELADLTPGGREPEDVDGLVHAIFHDPLYFKLKKERVHPAGAEALEARLRQQEAEERAERELSLAAASLQARLEGRAAEEGGQEAEDVTRRHLDALVDQAVFGKESEQGEVAEALMERLGVTKPKDPARRAFDLLVRLGEFEEDENLFVHRAGVRRRFPQAVVEEAERVAGHAVKPTRLTDLTGMLTVAIDDARTTEVDDAFAIRGDRLYVFIADAASVAPRGSEVDKEAFRRASTLYLPEGKVPMMPPVLGEQAGSLQEGVERSALCFSAEVTDDGRLVAFELSEALVCVDRRLTYDDVDALLAADPAGEPLAELIHEAAKWMERHHQAREQRGALMLQRTEVDIRVDDEGRVSIEPVNANGPARNLVSEMMVATCAATAMYCSDNQIPCVYRAQPAPDSEVDTAGAGDLDPAGQIAILRKLKPSELTTHANRHFTLGVPAYTQVTSPLRRYQDLLMHQQLRAVLRTHRPAFSDGELMQVFDQVDKQSRSLRRTENDTRRFWTLRYLEQHPDSVYEATAIRQLGKRWLVEIEDLALQAAFVPSGKLDSGDRLRLRVGEVDARRDKLALYESNE